MDYICSIYCLKTEFSDESCSKIVKELMFFNEMRFTKFCNGNARKNSEKLNLLQNFFNENKIKVWDIYQLGKSIGEVEDKWKNELLSSFGNMGIQEL